MYCCGDLLWASKIKSTGEAIGVGCRPVRNREMLAARLADSPVKAVLVDLTSEHCWDLMEALRKTKIDQHVMIGGPIQFDAKGQNPNIGSAAVQNRNRTPTVVLPADVAAAAPVLPMPAWQGRT